MRCEQCLKYIEDSNQCEVTCDYVLPINECSLQQNAERLWKVTNKQQSMINKEKLHQILSSLRKNDDCVGKMCYNQALQDVQTAIDSMQEEPVSEDLDEAAWNFAMLNPDYQMNRVESFRAGAKWQKEHLISLWKPADGEDLPEYDREVIAFQETFPTDADVPSLFKIVIAHRPNPQGYDGKSITTGEVEHYTPKTYGKGGWNIPDVVMWTDLDIPKLQED